MKELIKSVSEDLAKSIIEESFIDAKVIQVKVETALKILLSKNVRPVEVNVRFLEDKISRKNKQAQRDAIERDFWKEISKTYIGQNNIQQYYDRLNLLIKKEIEK